MQTDVHFIDLVKSCPPSQSLLQTRAFVKRILNKEHQRRYSRERTTSQSWFSSQATRFNFRRPAPPEERVSLPHQEVREHGVFIFFWMVLERPFCWSWRGANWGGGNGEGEEDARNEPLWCFLPAAQSKSSLHRSTSPRVLPRPWLNRCTRDGAPAAQPAARAKLSASAHWLSRRACIKKYSARIDLNIRLPKVQNNSNSQVSSIVDEKRKESGMRKSGLGGRAISVRIFFSVDLTILGRNAMNTIVHLVQKKMVNCLILQASATSCLRIASYFIREKGR